MINYKGYKLVENIDEAVVICEDIEKLTNDEWLELRRNNIGGSDEGILHHCGFSTLLDLQEDKLGIAKKPKRSYSDELTLTVGHKLEEVVLKTFADKNPGWRHWTDRRMFKHPVYHLAADCDGFGTPPSSEDMWIEEAKTTNEASLNDKWGNQDDNLVPEMYEWQCRHYMAVTGAKGVVICVLAGNNQNGFRQRFIERDFDKEVELIKTVEEFWAKHIEDREPIDLDSEDSAKILANLKEKYGKGKDKERVDVTDDLSEQLEKYLAIKAERSELEKKAKELKKAEESFMVQFADTIEENNGLVRLGEDEYNLSWKTSTRRSLPAASIEALLITCPDAKDYIKVSESTSLEVKKVKKSKKK